MKRVLLTGASGFIGSHCLLPLSALDYEVHAVDIKIPDITNNEVHWHRVNLLKPNQAADLVARIKPSHLLHLAWCTTPGKYWTSSENLLWVQASLAMIQAFCLHGGQRVLAAGTCAEYDWRYGYCSEEVTPRQPTTLYGVCKNSLQNMLRALAGEAGISAAWGRLFFLYGPHEHPQRVIPSVISRLLKGETAPCTDGAQIRDFLFVKDAAAALVALLASDVSGPVNIASGKPVALKDIFQNIAARLNRADLLRLGALNRSSEDPNLLVADVGRLTKEVGWSPQYDLTEGLERTIKWWKEQLATHEK